ncbi:hypothetical protein BDZ94DRAFT_1186716 [Collybia nuda]|uniref:WD40 repeat-like protein n=1 Tax=Collybia nuda TaxID=64659 RepID=A0A9P6CN72_9AGAR|nr:hypothetical protein BDZ94DRAFT_1186716 [Collybia nuda]
MVQQKRRVSYVIPPSTETTTKLQLPPHGTSRLGSVGPLLIPLANDRVQGTEDGKPRLTHHPRHLLGISSLALDTSTQLTGKGSPEGILYSGGRDGLIMSWDLGLPMKKKKLKGEAELTRRDSRWEIMTGWADDAIDEEGEDGEDRPQSDGDVLGEVTANSSRRRMAHSRTIPYENQWETDLAAFKPGKGSEFRQCAQANTDWVNDILLCNHNQTVISASSDGSVKSWSPHLTLSDPSTIGMHNDYVRCLAHSREQNWVASGSFDRTIKLWDLTRSDQRDPLVILNPPDATAPKSSVYALAADPFGQTIVSGSPERVVRLWDPRTGKRTGKLVGHTDNIRAILISDDSKYLLTGSADASIKLWSLSSQRCLHTFTHHTDSVWSLHSSHPSLEIFYSGDRSGLVCKVDVEDCSDVSEGECVLLCHDADSMTPSSDGINKIIALDDNLLWTASGHSNIKRWLVPQRRSLRAISILSDHEAEKHRKTESPTLFRRRDSDDIPPDAGTRPSTGHSFGASFAPSISSDAWPQKPDNETETSLYEIPFESLIRLVSPNDPFTPYTSSRGRDPEVATLYSAASVMSVPRTNAIRSPTSSNFKHTHASPIRSGRTEDTLHPTKTARADYEERELAASAIPLRTEPEEMITGNHGLVRSIILNDRMHALTVDTSGEVAIWDIVRGACLGRFLREHVAEASNAGSVAGSNDVERERSPREALEVVRERIEGEAVVSPWATADTKAGVLTIHLTERSFEAEVYADEVGFAQDRRFNDESKLNLGKWLLRNLFLGFIREEQRTRRGQQEATSLDGILIPSLGRVNSPTQSDLQIDTPKSAPGTNPKIMSSNSVIFSPNMVPALPPTATPIIRPSPLLTPMIPLYSNEAGLPHLSPIPQSPFVNSNDATPMPQRLRSSTIDSTTSHAHATAGKDDGYFSIRTRQPSLPGAPPGSIPSISDDTAWGGSGKTEPPTPNTPGGLIGRLKYFGKNPSKRPINDAASPPIVGVVVPPSDSTSEDILIPEVELPKTPLQILLSGPLNPPQSIDAPTHTLPPTTTIYISEEASPSFSTIYRGTVSSTKNDVQALEEAMPMWLIEYLLMDKSPPTPALAKISFVLLPWPTKDPKDQLPELLNTTQSKLTASRYLRVRKLVTHVQEKLDKIATSSDSKPHRRAEDEYEILCNEVLLPLSMSLAAVRQYVWKQGVELTMHYRRISPKANAHQEPSPS